MNATDRAARGSRCTNDAAQQPVVYRQHLAAATRLAQRGAVAYVSSWRAMTMRWIWFVP
jgi:hypothetical protein